MSCRSSKVYAVRFRARFKTLEEAEPFLTRLAQPIGARLVLLVADANASPRKSIPEIDRLTLIVQTSPCQLRLQHRLIQ
jgi:hypothetical protein